MRRPSGDQRAPADEAASFVNCFGSPPATAMTKICVRLRLAATSGTVT
jgi:hypothetical protein